MLSSLVSSFHLQMLYNKRGVVAEHNCRTAALLCSAVLDSSRCGLRVISADVSVCSSFFVCWLRFVEGKAEAGTHSKKILPGTSSTTLVVEHELRVRVYKIYYYNAYITGGDISFMSCYS
jgi:hypothetical protein